MVVHLSFSTLGHKRNKLALILSFLCSYGGILSNIEARLNDRNLNGSDAVPFSNSRPGPSTTGSNNKNIPGSFDFYILSMTYLPQFCYLNRSNSFPGCNKPDSSWRGSLTIHGLWPENTDGSYPTTCSNEEFRESTIDQLGKERFEKYWPNLKETSSSSSYTQFWDHEWTKHGTCSGLSQDEYFDMTLNHFLPSPDIVSDNYGSSVSKEDLMRAYGGSELDVVMVCTKGKYLYEVRTCVGKVDHGSERVKCPTKVLEEGSCGNIIHIPKFYVDVDADGDDALVSVEKNDGFDGRMEIE